MSIVEIIQVVIRESATAALALFAIWMVRQLYEQRLGEHKEYSESLEQINSLLVAKLDEMNKALGTNTEVIRQNTKVLEGLQAVLEKRE